MMSIKCSLCIGVFECKKIKKKNITFTIRHIYACFLTSTEKTLLKTKSLEEISIISARVKTKKKKKFSSSPAGNRTPVSRVTGGDTHHYTTEDPASQ